MKGSLPGTPRTQIAGLGLSYAQGSQGLGVIRRKRAGRQLDRHAGDSDQAASQFRAREVGSSGQARPVQPSRTADPDPKLPLRRRCEGLRSVQSFRDAWSAIAAVWSSMPPDARFRRRNVRKSEASPAPNAPLECGRTRRLGRMWLAGPDGASATAHRRWPRRGKSMPTYSKQLTEGSEVHPFGGEQVDSP